MFALLTTARDTRTFEEQNKDYLTFHDQTSKITHRLGLFFPPKITGPLILAYNSHIAPTIITIFHYTSCANNAVLQRWSISYAPMYYIHSLVAPDLPKKRGSGTKKFGAVRISVAPIRLLHFKFDDVIWIF